MGVGRSHSKPITTPRVFIFEEDCDFEGTDHVANHVLKMPKMPEIGETVKGETEEVPETGISYIFIYFSF